MTALPVQSPLLAQLLGIRGLQTPTGATPGINPNAQGGVQAPGQGLMQQIKGNPDLRFKLLLSAAAPLLAASSPGGTLGQGLGGAIQGALGTANDFQTNQIRNALAAKQLKGKLVPIIGPDGKPRLVRESEAEGASPAPGFGGAANKQRGQGVLVETENGPAFATPVFDPNTGTIQSQLTPIGSDSILSRLGETPEERQARDVSTARERATAVNQANIASIPQEVSTRGTATRRESFVQAGVDAAERLPSLRRSIDILKSVKTGGIEGLQLFAKQQLGIESADEGELSNALAKDVISQLRSVFGNQFTEREGRQLKDIEAGIGKSTEANLRLLERAERIAKSAAERAMRLSGDDETKALIQELMQENIAPPAAGKGDQAATPQTQADFDALPNGALYRDPDDGKLYRK